MARSINQILLSLRLGYVNTAQVGRDKFGRLIQPTPVSPRMDALQYIRIARKLQRQINNETLEAINPLVDYATAQRQDDAQTDAIDGVFRSLEADTTESIERGTFETSVLTVGFDVLLFNNEKYSRGIYETVGLNNLPTITQRGMLDSWVSENLRLIKNVNTTQLSSLQTLILRATRDGMTNQALTAEISKAMDVSLHRASLIASDQTYKLDGQLDRAKQENSGVTHYTWTTMGDDRVRPTHRALNGTRRSWKSDAPHPGQPVACRCFAKPYLENLFKK